MSTTEVTSSASQWVERLRERGSERDDALQELRSILIRSLRRSFADQGEGKLAVEDIVQEALVKILASLGSFQGRSRFTTWAVTIANRVGISKLRRLHYRDLSLDAIESGRELEIDRAGDGSGGTQRDLERKAVLDSLRRVIAESLTDKQRLVIRGTLEGLPIEEIARRTGSKRNAIYKLAHDARQRLRTELEESGVTAQDIEAIFF